MKRMELWKFAFRQCFSYFSVALLYSSLNVCYVKNVDYLIWDYFPDLSCILLLLFALNVGSKRNNTSIHCMSSCTYGRIDSKFNFDFDSWPTDEMKTFAGQQIEPLFQFSWLVVFLTLLLCGSVALILGFTVDPRLAISVSLSLLALLYIFFGKEHITNSWNYILWWFCNCCEELYFCLTSSTRRAVSLEAVE